MDKLSEVVSEPAGTLIPVPSDGFTGDDTEVDEQSGGEGGDQGGGGAKAGLVDLRDWDVERDEGGDLVQILESRR